MNLQLFFCELLEEGIVTLKYFQFHMAVCFDGSQCPPPPAYIPPNEYGTDDQKKIRKTRQRLSAMNMCQTTEHCRSL